MRPGALAGGRHAQLHLPLPPRYAPGRHPVRDRSSSAQAHRQSTQPSPKLAFGGTGGNLGSGGKRPGGGRGPWWQDGSDEGESADGRDQLDVSTKASASLRWKGWQERVDADPNFRDKVLIEQIIGVAASVVGDMSSRPCWGLYELDFVFSTLVVGSILNFSLMYFLAPTTAGVAGGAAAGSFMQRLFSDVYLRSWGAPTGHLFEAGFPLSKRLINFGYKGVIFGIIGLGAGVIGTATSNGLLKLRKQLDPSFKPQNKPPDVGLNAATWALHMGLSSNLRYQALNGFDMVVSPKVSPATFRIITSALRTFNNVLGGVSFVTMARLTGVQAAGGSVEEELPAAADA